jgi:DNA-binding HxlR family transcriptional regulator
MHCLEPSSSGYRLTPSGQALLPVVSLAQAWDAAASPRANRYLHQCGKSFTPVLVCSCCARPVRAKDIHLDCPGDIPDLQYLPKPMRRSRAEFTANQGLRAAELLGDRWTALIVALGFYGVQRYSDIARHLAIAPNILADRLLRLCEGNVLLRQAEHETGRPVYRFSERGLQLFSLIVVLIEWGDHWLRLSHQSPTLMRHLPCGEVLKPLLRCSSCGENAPIGSLSEAPT